MSSSAWKRVTYLMVCVALQAEASYKSRAPEIVLPPRSVTVVRGNNAELNCKATGIPTPKIHWLKNKDRLKLRLCEERSRVCIGKDGTLVVRNAGVVEDSGKYRCIVRNSAGKVKSGVVKMDVHHKDPMPPLFLNNLQDETGTVGETLTLNCQAGGSQDIHVSWSREDGDRQLPEDRFLQLQDNSLRIVELELSDAGYYACTAENEFGWVSQMMYLSVAAPRQEKTPLPDPPVSFNPLPKDEEVVVGETAFFDCNVIGPYLTTQMWLIGDLQDDGETVLDRNDSLIGARSLGNVTMVLLDKRFFFFPNGTLAIYNVTLREEGVYVCRALQLEGNRTDVTATLTVEELIPTPTSTTSEGPSSATPEIRTDGPIDGRPDQVPTGVIVVPLNSTAVQVSWTYPDISSTRRPSQYIISYALTATKPQGQKTVVVNGRYRYTMSHTVVGLKPYTEYIIHVLASNDEGAGSRSDPKTVRTLEDVPCKGPSNVRINILDDEGKVRVRWDPLSTACANGDLMGYTVTYSCDPGHETINIRISGTGQTSKEIHLRYGDTCQLSIKAFNGAGDGQFSRSVGFNVVYVTQTTASASTPLNELYVVTPSFESQSTNAKVSASEPFTKSTYFIIIIVTVAVTIIVLTIMLTICVVHKRRSDEMNLGKGLGHRTDPTGARTSGSYEVEDMTFPGGLNKTTSSSSCRTPRGYFPAPPSRPAPTPSLAMSVSLQHSIGGSTPVSTELYLEPEPKGSANQLDYEYASEGPHLEDHAPPIPNRRPAVRPGYPVGSVELPDYMGAYAADGNADDSSIGFDPSDRRRRSSRSYDLEYGKDSEKGRTVSFQGKERGIPSKMNNAAHASRNLDVQLMGRQSQL